MRGTPTSQPTPAPAPPAPAPPAPAPPAPAPPAPAPPADSENVPPETQDAPADEDLLEGSPPKRARVSELKDCLEALRAKFEEEHEETFKVNVALAWCKANGAKKISLIVKAKCVDAFVDHLGLEFVPAMGLKNMLLEEYA